MLVSPAWRRVAPFGVQFVDDQTGRFVGDGLVVTGWPAREPSRRVVARANRSAVFSLRDVPGIGDLEMGTGDDAYWSTVPRRPFVIDVEDLGRRFLPFRFTVELPLRGLLQLTCGSPPAAPGPTTVRGVPLFTAPTRPAVPGSAVLRADLWDTVAQAPAAWAVVEASIPSAVARGVPPVRALADERGQIALHLPCPDEEDLDGGSFESPSGPGPVALTARTWSVDLTAGYGQLSLDPLAAALTLRTPIPDLCAAVMQPPATLWSDRSQTTPLTRASLTFGRETILRSIGSGAGPQSVLFLTPGSPP
jgi:hypothetical protein